MARKQFMESQNIHIHIHLPEFTDFQVDTFYKALANTGRLKAASEEYKKAAQEFYQTMQQALAEMVRAELKRVSNTQPPRRD
jgi:RPA family protein